jgi:hypothetical protein
LHITIRFIKSGPAQSPPRSTEVKHFNSVEIFHWTISMTQYLIFRMSLVWFIWAISLLHMAHASGLIFLDHSTLAAACCAAFLGAAQPEIARAGRELEPTTRM